MRIFFFILSFGLVTCSSVAQTSSFNVTYTGFTPAAQASFQYAINKWSNILVSDVPIKVNAAFFPMGTTGLLGITFPNGRRDFPAAPLSDTWYATSLANALSSTELNQGESDIDIFLNASVLWYFDSTGNVPASQYDFGSVVMHELCHGFGFVSLAKKQGNVGSFGLVQQSDFAPLAPSFPWPELDTLPGIFDRFLVKNSGEQLDTFQNPGTALGASLTSNNVYFKGTNAITANNGTLPRIYAPATFELGSSISHLNESTYPAGNANEMMTPNGTPGNANHDPGPIVIGALRDIGWDINPALSIHSTFEQKAFSVFPNPVTNELVATLPEYRCEENILTINDLAGRVVMVQLDYHANASMDLSEIPDGYYIISLLCERSTYKARFVKYSKP